ncbi:hypothetical protein Tco_0856811 [Tanacetum coccineum]|uniref:Reverse transcriptase domain-containing protein n=1 Tax=Tanacetum coccineum TaxID=301880 RepID=A0ABQ5B677_9ASTR
MTSPKPNLEYKLKKALYGLKHGTPPKSGSSEMVTLGCDFKAQQSRYRKRPQRDVLNKGVTTSTPEISFEVAELKDMVKALLLDKKNQSPAPTPVKAVEESCVTCGGAHSYQTCPATSGNHTNKHTIHGSLIW